jgi:hypothetical protein
MSLQPYQQQFTNSLTPFSDWQLGDPFMNNQLMGQNLFSPRFQNEISKPIAPLMTADLVETDSEYNINADLPAGYFNPRSLLNNESREKIHPP